VRWSATYRDVWKDGRQIDGEIDRQIDREIDRWGEGEGWRAGSLILLCLLEPVLRFYASAPRMHMCMCVYMRAIGAWYVCSHFSYWHTRLVGGIEQMLALHCPTCICIYMCVYA